MRFRYEFLPYKKALVPFAALALSLMTRSGASVDAQSGRSLTAWDMFLLVS